MKKELLMTDRLILRRFNKNDLDDLYEYLSEIKVHCFKDMLVKDIKECKKALMMRIKSDDEYFAIVLQDSGKVIGEIFAGIENDPNSIDGCNVYSPCWILNDKYQGKGYMYEACVAYYDYLFNECNARRIYTYTEDDNIKSQNLCKKLGMRCEGLYKEFIAFVKDDDGNLIYENTYEFAILKKEWEKR